MKASAEEKRQDNIMFKLIPYLMREEEVGYREKKMSNGNCIINCSAIFRSGIYAALRIAKVRHSKFSKRMKMSK